MLVHSYARFSDPSQEGGDSLRRQQQAAEEFCIRKGWTLSDLKFTDAGRSGFNGDKQRALNAFLKAVDNGRVKPGETLLVEAVDRLSRKGVRATQNLVNKLLDFGINIAILVPVEKVYRADDKNDIGGAIELAAFAYQANTYSANLSSRLKSWNENARTEYRNGNRQTISSVAPSWLELDDGTFRKKPEPVKAIKYIFKRTIDGIGRKCLCKELNAKFKPITSRKNSHSWNEQMVATIIKERRVVGDLQSTVTGETLKKYYPPIIDEKTWKKANAESNKRRTERGPSTQRINLFNGILFHAVDDCKMGFHAYQQTRKSGKVVKFRRYKSYLATNGVAGASTATVDVDAFEELIFNFMPQLELKNKPDDRNAELTAERDYLKSEIDAMQKQIVSREVSASVLVKPLMELQSQLEETEKHLTNMPQRQVAPTKNYRSKLSKMRRGTIAERLLVRDRMRDIVEKIHCYPIKLGTKRSDRVRVLVEIHFKTGEFVRALELPDNKLVKIKGSTVDKADLRQQCSKGWRFTPKDYEKVVDLMS